MSDSIEAQKKAQEKCEDVLLFISKFKKDLTNMSYQDLILKLSDSSKLRNLEMFSLKSLGINAHYNSDNNFSQDVDSLLSSKGKKKKSNKYK